MKKFYLFMFVALFSVSEIRADVFTPYSVDFEEAIKTSDHDFKVAAGWGHIVDYLSGWSRQYVSYAQTSDGVDGSKCLSIGKQTFYSWGTKTTNDILVTPKLSGTVTLNVKSATKEKGTIEFYTITEDANGALSKGTKITGVKGISAINDGNFVTITLPDQKQARIGIRGENVFIDNFKADSAEYNLVTAAKLTGVEVSEGRTVYGDDNDNFKITFNVTINNAGETTLDSTTKGYAITMYHENKSTWELDSIDYIPLTEEIEPGASATVPVEFFYTYNQYPDFQSFYFVDGISGTKRSCSVTSVPHKPIMKIQNMSNYNFLDIEKGDSIDFGAITNDSKITIKIWNDGGSTLKLSDIYCSGDFETSVDSISVDRSDWNTFDITAKALANGEKAGTLTIKSNAGDCVVGLKSIVSGVTTGINQVIGNLTSGKWYNIKGQMVSSSQIRRGIFINNGKKVIRR